MSGSGKENIMRNHLKLADSYLRLSDEEKKYGNESESITNQREIIRDYCQKQGIIIVSEFVDDGYSGGNFERPGFQAMLNHLAAGKANTVITKDLSRLGRDTTRNAFSRSMVSTIWHQATILTLWAII